jgi:hypothetical protein
MIQIEELYQDNQMYNRILKRPMFMRGGMGYSAQGTGITSGMDTPRPRYYGGGAIGGGVIQGNPMGNRTGFNQPWFSKDPYTELEEIQTKKEEIFAPKKNEFINDVISSFGAYASPRREDGSYMTTGEMGAVQAQEIKKIRDAREEKRQLAKLSGLESEEEMLKGDIQHIKERDLKNMDNNAKMALAEYEGGIQLQIAELAKQNTATGRRLHDNDQMLKEEIAAAKGDEAKIAAAKAKHKKNREIIISGTNLMAEALKIAASLSKDSMKKPEDILADVLIIIKGLESQNLRSGGRVGYYAGTPNTGAMPMEPVQASITESIDTPGEDMTMTETVTEGQPTVEMPYEQFRAAIPAEVNDEIVQLIYYNQDAFAAFAQISTQADVYAFNNKYGVSLVLPMDTETT